MDGEQGNMLLARAAEPPEPNDIGDVVLDFDGEVFVNMKEEDDGEGAGGE